MKKITETLKKLLDICFKYNLKFEFNGIGISASGRGTIWKVQISPLYEGVAQDGKKFVVDEGANIHRIGGGNGVYKPGDIKRLFEREFNINISK